MDFEMHVNVNKYSFCSCCILNIHNIIYLIKSVQLKMRVSGIFILSWNHLYAIETYSCREKKSLYYVLENMPIAKSLPN